MTDKLIAAAEHFIVAWDSLTTVDLALAEPFVEAIRQALDQLPDSTKMIDPNMGLIQSEWAGLEKSDIPIDRGAWADVSGATKWVDELRGDDDLEESPNSTTDFVEREWQGLTDEELNDLARWADEHGGAFYVAYGKAIEAKLKEKNNG